MARRPERNREPRERPKWLTVRQVAEMLEVNPRHVWEWIVQGRQVYGRRERLRASFLGRWRVKRCWVRKFLALLTAERLGEPDPAVTPGKNEQDDNPGEPVRHERFRADREAFLRRLGRIP